ncbi:hypothetical protein [Hymenobacter ruricola]|uniref:Bulb-type lectin domain-containing protein n=1 Tax=Hymenobacter ruricola TaxID=2791023 RepID=A0ABS0HYC3_9BACT|nr:hypothetical protein [Hymenobacter ruricola]MBF9219690.1 hypothetical protein [Hymenobacter ruricola]
MRYFLFFLLCLPLGARAQVLPWAQGYGTTVDETGGYAVAMPGGGYLLAGQQPYANGFASRLYLVRTNDVGDTLWTKRVSPPYALLPTLSGMVRDASGNVLLTGYENGRGNQTGFAMKLNPIGDTLWTRTYRPALQAGSTGQTYVFPAIIASDGNYLFVRNDNDFLPSPPYFIATVNLYKVNAPTGNVMWSFNIGNYLTAAGFDPPNTQYANPVISGNNITMLVEGTLGGNTNGVKGYFLFNSTTGALVQFRRRDGLYLNDNIPTSSVTQDGNILMGRRQNITKITPVGDTLWRTVAPSRYANRSWDARAIVEDAQGGLLLVGDSQYQNGGAGGSSN